jgi:type I restriction enzyme R subunit
MHGLIQAYSRTNRILNAVKNCGNIVCFRNLEEATNKSLGIFGDENASGLVFMKSFDEYYKDGYEDEQGKLHEPYVTLIERLQNDFPVEGIPNVVDMETKKSFIRLFGEILRLRNLLSVFDEFTDDARLIGDMQYQDYMGWYNKLYDEIRKPKPTEENESITDDIVFEMELVKQVQIDIRYILELVQQYHDTNCQDKEIIVKMRKLIDASPDMRDKKELIERFLERITPQGSGNVGNQWEDYIEQEKREQLQTIINDERLKREETIAFIRRAFADGYVTETGTGIAKILPPSNPFLPESGEKKQTVINKLKDYLKRFLGTVEPVTVNVEIHNHYHGTVETVVNVEQQQE